MYSQPIKNKSRSIVWKNAIEAVTVKREESKVLNHIRMRKLWDYCFSELKRKGDANLFNNWVEFSYSIYGNKKPSDLKIAYLCGPEPQNDLEILVQSGVKIENIWAVEKDDSIYKQALMQARDGFPNLKIFKGSFDDFIKISDIAFDIIYLDFTGPIFSRESKPFITINTVFEEQALSDLGILITNFSEPEFNKDSIEFLASYFLNQAWIENGIYGNENEGIFVEGPIYQGFHDIEKLKGKISENFDCAYSAFCTHYPVSYSNIIAPAFRTIKNSSMRAKLYNEEVFRGKLLDKIIQSIEEYVEDFEEDIDWEELLNEGNAIEMQEGEGINQKSLFYEESTMFPYWHFIKEIKNRKNKLNNYWSVNFDTKEQGISRFHAIVLRDLLRNYSVEKSVINSDLLRYLKDIDTNMRKYDIFCDIPLDFLWLELSVNQLGSPYHSQFNNHFRYKYKAKAKNMYLDIFTFDKCRALYDWIPFPELLADFTKVVENQMLLRSMLDLIGGKQTIRVLPELYWASNIIGRGSGTDLDNAFVEELPKRSIIEEE